MIYNAVDRNFHFVKGETTAQARARQMGMVEIGMWYLITAIEGLDGADLEGELFLRGLYGDVQ